MHVDALLVINNERLREIYSDLTFMNAFGKADDTLSIAAKSIAEIITMGYVITGGHIVYPAHSADLMLATGVASMAQG